MASIGRVDDDDMAGYAAAAAFLDEGSFSPASSSFLPPYPQQYSPWPWSPEPEATGLLQDIPEYASNDVVDDELFAAMCNLPISAVPFAQPAVPSPPPPPPPQMQMMPMQMQSYSHLQPACVAMQGSHHGFGRPWQATAASAPVHAAPFAAGLHAVVPADAPPSEPAKRRRGRPRGSTAASKSKLADTAATSRQKKAPRRADPAATPAQQERPTEHPAAAATSAIVVAQHHHDELEADCRDKRKRPEEAAAGVGEAEEEQEEFEYADTNPPGVRFRPSDAELIGYLKLKYLGRKMPVDFIKEFDVCTNHPNTVQEKCGNSVDGAWYVLSPRSRKYGNGRRPARTVGPNDVQVGFWKSNTKETVVVVDGVVIGTVNTLTFHLGEQPKGLGTDWKMKELSIPEYKIKPDGKVAMLDPWVICKIYYQEKSRKATTVKKGGSRRSGEVDGCANETEGDGEECTTDDKENERLDGGHEEQDLCVVNECADVTEGGGEEGTTDGKGNEQLDVDHEEQGLCVVDECANGTEDDGKEGITDGKEQLDNHPTKQDLCVEDYLAFNGDDFYLTFEGIFIRQIA